MDFTGQLQTLVDFHQATYPDDSFEKIQKIYLREHEGLYKLNQISPRCFEAIALKTVLVLYEGDYSGILTAGQHYIPLKKDFSNIQEVIAKIKNTAYLQAMANKAYEDIALNSQYHYSSFIQRFDDIITNEFKQRDKRKAAQPYQPDDLQTSLSAFDFPVAEHPFEEVKRKVAIRPILSRALHLLINRFAQSATLRKFKFFLTQRVVIFNPLLRVIKRRLLQLI